MENQKLTIPLLELSRVSSTYFDYTLASPTLITLLIALEFVFALEFAFFFLCLLPSASFFTLAPPATEMYYHGEKEE